MPQKATGFNLDALAGQKAIAKVDFMGQSASLIYDPNVLTAKNVVEASSNDDAFTAFFCSLVLDWDVKEGGRKVPITPERLKGIPLGFLKECWAAIRGSQNGDSEEGKA